MDSADRKIRGLVREVTAEAYGANFDYSCANCHEGEADHDDDGACPHGGTTYERRASPRPVTIPVVGRCAHGHVDGNCPYGELCAGPPRSDGTVGGDDTAGTPDHNRRV